MTPRCLWILSLFHLQGSLTAIEFGVNVQSRGYDQVLGETLSC